MMNFLNRIFAAKAPSCIPALYGVIMTQARRGDFYGEAGLADTFENRFEVLALHMFLLLNRLKDDGLQGRDLSQALVDYMVADLDRTCREMGVGDVGVAKRMKTFMEHFYGRLQAYENALCHEDKNEILRALDKNLLASLDTDLNQLARFRDYLFRQKAHLAGLSINDLQKGFLSFSNEG